MARQAKGTGGSARREDRVDRIIEGVLRRLDVPETPDVRETGGDPARWAELLADLGGLPADAPAPAAPPAEASVPAGPAEAAEPATPADAESAAP